MNGKLLVLMLWALTSCWVVLAQGDADWWNSRWRFRTSVVRPAPYPDGAARPVEVALDFPLLLQRAGVAGEFDPGSVRVVQPGAGAATAQIPCIQRTEPDPRTGRPLSYLAWITEPGPDRLGRFDVYFETTDRGISAPAYDADRLPPENLLSNPGFEEGLTGWAIEPAGVAAVGACEHTTDRQSLQVGLREWHQEDGADGRTVTISQDVDARDFAGQEMVFECDLLAERAAYGLPVCIELQQFRADGSRIPECAVEPRWLTLELAQGQLVQFRQRGRFNPEAATVRVSIRMRCYVIDADTGEWIEGPESAFTAWLDRVVLRPGERWPWPEATNAGFVAGAIPSAPLNRGFEFTGQRRLGFNGGSEATMTAGAGDHGPQAVHWGLQQGTLELWCRPSWDAEDGRERAFFTGYAYLYRLQSRLRKLGADGDNQLEFAISDSNRELHTVRGPAALQAGRWHHIAATWDHTRAHLQLFVDGRRVGVEGPGAEAWPSTLEAAGPEQFQGQGINDTDKRSLPMQAFLGGRMAAKVWPEGDAVEAALDEVRISDVVRYEGDFTPQPVEFALDDNTRALWHFENEWQGVHGGDDRFVRSYAGCELPPQSDSATLEVLGAGGVDRRTVVVKPYAPESLFERNRGDRRLVDRWTADTEVPDPRFVEYRQREVEGVVSGPDDALTLNVEGDHAPLMRWVTWERAEGAGEGTTLVPHWRANDNVVPLSVQSLAETLAPDAATDAERAFAVMQYVLDSTAYYDAPYCETLPSGRHRPRVSYSFLKPLNIYPFDQCGPLNYTLRKLFLAVGISSNDSPGTHHQFQQAYFDGDWRLYDLASRVYWLERDNESVMGLREVGEDPFAKLRQPGNLNSYFPGRGNGPAFGTATRPHNMDFFLRAGEQASICWQNEGRWFELKGEREPISLANVPPYFANGAIVYRPTAEGEAAELTNLALTVEEGVTTLGAQDPQAAATLIYRAACPYILSDARVTGRYEADAPGAITLALSFDEGRSWTEVWRSPEASGALAVGLGEQVAARYAYWLKLELMPGSGARVIDPAVRTTFVASALSLPGTLALGTNRISFVGGPVSEPIRTRCSWVERHDSDLGVSLNTLSYYQLDHQSHRNVLVAAPGEALPVEVTLYNLRDRAEVTLAGLPEGWGCEPARQTIDPAGDDAEAAASFVLSAGPAVGGQVQGLEVVVRRGDQERRVPVQVLVASAPLVREAEAADGMSGEVAVAELPELSGARAMRFTGDGELSFDCDAARAGGQVVWVRGRWEPGSRSPLVLRVDEGDPRRLSATTLIGFGDWTDPGRAFTKGFVHYATAGEQWAWYRIVGPDLDAGRHRLTLSAGAGAWIDAVVMLPDEAALDRAATNLFVNWNYAPWDNPL